MTLKIEILLAGLLFCFGCSKSTPDPRIAELEAKIKKLKSGDKTLDAADSRYTAATGRIAEVEARVKELTINSHLRWRVHEGKFSISTTDRPANTKFRLVYGTNAVQRFEERVPKEGGRILTAWVSDWTPRSEMTKFEQFSVSHSQDNVRSHLINTSTG